MEDAGLTRDTLFAVTDSAQRLAGVFVGVMYGDTSCSPEEAARGNLIAPNAAYWNVANRVSHFLDLHGPSMAIDTACSSSLTAIHTLARHCATATARSPRGRRQSTVHPGSTDPSKSGFPSSDGAAAASARAATVTYRAKASARCC